jgi:hypothetical protein
MLMKRVAAVAAPVVLSALLLGAPALAVDDDKDCGDFPSRAAAQAFFVANGGPGSDPHRLDADDDGQACENHNYGGGAPTTVPKPAPGATRSPKPSPSTATPENAPAAEGAQTLPVTGAGVGYLVGGGAAFVLAGAAGMAWARRRPRVR